MSDSRGQSTFTKQREQREQVAVALATERLPWHPAIGERFGIERSAWRALVEAVFPSAKSTEGVILALSYCKARNLDPFKRVVHIVPIWQRGEKGQKGHYVETVWPGIGETRTTAMRTGNYGGCDDTKFGPDIDRTWTVTSDDDQGNQRTKSVTLTFPEWAQVTIYRYRGELRYAIPGPRAYWLETYAKESRWSEIPNEMWLKRPRGQIEKCFGPETEVLTDMGFQQFDAVTGRIMQVTKIGIEPTESLPFRQEWSGPMVTAGGDALNFRVTPNHDMVTTGGKIEAMSLFDCATSLPKFRIPISVEGTRPEAPISDQAIALTGMFVCDGWRRPYGTFCIGVSRPAKIAAIEALGLHRGAYLHRCAGNEAVTETRIITTNHDKTIYTFDETSMGGLAHLDKHFDRDALISLSRRQAKLLVDAMLASDGADNGRGTMRFYSSYQRILAAFEIAAVAAGYSVSQRRVRISDIGGPNYYVTVSDKVSLPVLRYSASQAGKGGSKAGIEVAPMNEAGVVWCCVVPSGVIIVRRHGMSMLCGNCAEAGALRRGFPEEIGDEPTADEMGYGGHTIDPEGNRLDQDDTTPKADPVQTSVQNEERRQPAQQASTARASTAPTQTALARAGSHPAGNKGEPVTQQERKVEPKTEPKTEPTGEATTKAAQSSPQTGTATSAPFDPETGEIKDEPLSTNANGTVSNDGGFEAWLVNADERETTVEPYSDALEWASALATLCAGQSPDVVAAILNFNDAAMTECREASAPAGAVLDAIKVSKAAQDEPTDGHDQGSAGNAKPVIEVLNIDDFQTPGKKTHWPNYATAFKERLDQCGFADEATAWMTKNEPVYRGKCTIATENQIRRHYDQTMTRLAGQSDGATAPDAERAFADKLMEEIRDFTNLKSLSDRSEEDDVKKAMARWHEERRELYDEVKVVGNKKFKELEAAIG